MGHVVFLHLKANLTFSTKPTCVGDMGESDDDEKTGADLAEHILRDFNHEIKCKLMEKDRGLKVSWVGLENIT